MAKKRDPKSFKEKGRANPRLRPSKFGAKEGVQPVPKRVRGRPSRIIEETLKEKPRKGETPIKPKKRKKK